VHYWVCVVQEVRACVTDAPPGACSHLMLGFVLLAPGIPTPGIRVLGKWPY